MKTIWNDDGTNGPVLICPAPPMKTQVNGRDAPWTEAIKALWETKTQSWSAVERASVESCNYFTPRPYVDEWNRGSNFEGFVYVLPRYLVAGRVCIIEWRAR